MTILLYLYHYLFWYHYMNIANGEIIMKNILNLNVLLLAALVLLVICSRLLPHPLNFTPIGALGLFSGAYILDRKVWMLPLIALLLSDFVIGFYNPISMFFVYFGFALSAFIGRWALSEKRAVLKIAGAAICSATMFFIVSNFGTWLSGTLYPMTISGLMECYVMAIPFYGNTLAGDLFYAAILFGTYEGVKQLFNKEADLHSV
jgi:uncharacterized protein DUF6580